MIIVVHRELHFVVGLAFFFLDREPPNCGASAFGGNCLFDAGRQSPSLDFLLLSQNRKRGTDEQGKTADRARDSLLPGKSAPTTPTRCRAETVP
jgi:hypothetical protein